MRELDGQAVEAAVAGGSVLACGGGGWVPHGYLVGRTAVSFGTPKLATLDEIDPDALIVMVTAIGAPAAADWEMQPRDYVRALQLVAAQLDEPIVGTITAQNGSSTTLNGWMQSAVLGTLVLDAAGDGRAHPTGKMGSIGLTSESDYEAIQACAGGNRAQNRYLECTVRGTVASCANTLRTAAVQSGGFIAAARNPVRASYVREHAAVGAISFALDLGEAMLAAESTGGEAVIEAICTQLGGTVLGRGPVRDRIVRTEGGFDIGSLQVGDLDVGLVNEYLSVDAGGQRLATFPDVLTTLSLATGRPISIADIRDGDEVAVLHVPHERIPIGDSVLDPSVYPEVEEMLGRPLLSYAVS
ncbi:hypothetical protein DSM104299_00201 [Baekduia alba]|uniref:DUF917 domain-containing protein n=1 Tax=Baekduia alba TaxID=2997333 RepID=UPI0023422CA1|nr:DUF917 family protein [Baekduia alba]WCB91530.1 hypothetical protein DSM104299_00201 [Baekduia alba]